METNLTLQTTLYSSSMFPLSAVTKDLSLGKWEEYIAYLYSNI